MKTRILNIISTPRGIGGAERLLLEMSDKFDRERFPTSYCNLFDIEKGEGEFPTVLREKGFEVFNFKGQEFHRLPQLFAGLVNLLRKEKFDVVNTHLLQATIVGQFAARLAGFSKRVVTRHYTDDTLTNHSAVLRQLERRALRGADKIAVVSEAVGRDVINAGVPDAKVELIHNGVDLEKFDRALNAAEHPNLEFAEDEFIIGNIANLWTRKGHADLIRALPRILAHIPRARLVIVGEGVERLNLEKLCAELGVADKVRFAGFQREVAPLLKRFDLYVHPAHQEPFGIALLEAMAARKCVVATAVGGVPEIVVPQETGVLVPVKDSDGFADAVINLVEQNGAINRMADAGRRRVEEIFSLDAVVGKYEKLYEEVTRQF